MTAKWHSRSPCFLESHTLCFCTENSTVWRGVVCVFACVCTGVCIHLPVFTYTHVFVYVCMCIYRCLHMCASASMYICICACVCKVFSCVCVFVCIWRPEVDTSHLSPLLPTLIFEAGSLTGTESTPVRLSHLTSKSQQPFISVSQH